MEIDENKLYIYIGEKIMYVKEKYDKINYEYSTGYQNALITLKAHLELKHFK